MDKLLKTSFSKYFSFHLHAFHTLFHTAWGICLLEQDAVSNSAPWWRICSLSSVLWFEIHPSWVRLFPTVFSIWPLTICQLLLASDLMLESFLCVHFFTWNMWLCNLCVILYMVDIANSRSGRMVGWGNSGRVWCLL